MSIETSIIKEYLALILHRLHFLGGLRGASIIDSLDTLYIMGLMDEYNDAKEWVKTSLDLNSVRKIYLFSFLSAVFLFAGSGLNTLWCSSHIHSTALCIDTVDVISKLTVVHIFTPLGSSPSL